MSVVAHSTNIASLSSVATRHTARTFEYDNRPSANIARTTGNPSRARATFTCSRAVRSSIPQRQPNQWPHDRTPSSSHPSRRSNSATSSSQRAWYAAISAAPATIKRPSSATVRAPSTRSSTSRTTNMFQVEHDPVTVSPAASGTTP